MSASSEVAGLVSRINVRYDTTFEPVGRYLVGENQGAYQLKDAGNSMYVLKWNYNPGWLTRIKLARKITNLLRKSSPLVPQYILADVFPGAETYWLQTVLPGQPVSSLTIEQTQELIRFNDLQAGQALSPKQNWSAYIASVVFEDASGWHFTLYNHSNTGMKLLKRLRGFVAGTKVVCDKTGDIVHGDLNPANVLLENRRVSGIVDWDAAGCGDRAFDLALLFFYCYQNPQVRTLLFERIVELTGLTRLKVYVVYAILSQLDWSIRHHAPGDVNKLFVSANLIINDLEAL